MTKVTPKQLRAILAVSPNAMARVQCDDQEFEASSFWTALHARRVRGYLAALGLRGKDVRVRLGTGADARTYSIAPRAGVVA